MSRTPGYGRPRQAQGWTSNGPQKYSIIHLIKVSRHWSVRPAEIGIDWFWKMVDSGNAHGWHLVQCSLLGRLRFYLDAGIRITFALRSGERKTPCSTKCSLHEREYLFLPNKTTLFANLHQNSRKPNFPNIRRVWLSCLSNARFMEVCPQE